MIKPGLLVCLLIYGVITLCSCNAYKKATYFEDTADSTQSVFIKEIPFKSPRIQPDDILIITVQTEDINTNNILNATSAGQVMPNGYLVDKDGYVKLPFIGKVEVDGLTTKEASDLIEREVNKQFNNAIVNLRFGNFKVTVLGEVGKPATYVMPNEKVNIFDVLGLAGDITLDGKRDNVLLVRDSSSVEGKKAVRLNLNSKNIVASPYFFLKPNDMVYVPPMKSRVNATNNGAIKYISLALGFISVISIIIYRFF